MFLNCQLKGMVTGYPDVCLTPAPPSPSPVPTPYPCNAARPMAVPNQMNVLIMGAPVHTVSTKVPQTNGDNAGVAMGVASGTVMGPCQSIMASILVSICGMPATRLMDPSIMNSTNCPGAGTMPSQELVSALA